MGSNKKILVVDDNEAVCASLGKILESHGFQVTCACNVTQALRLITLHRYDVLLSDLHMPGAGDGLTVVSAMRHANPDAITLLLSAYPEMSEAANAILMQTDQILVKPMSVSSLVNVITQRIAKEPLQPCKSESLVTILQRTMEASINTWYANVESNPLLSSVPLSREARCHHLPELFRDLAYRLQTFQPLGTHDVISKAAWSSGKDRRRQGYTAAMIVEESRLLQTTVFETLQRNLSSVDFSHLLPGVMTIADEIDSQLSQAMESFYAAPAVTMSETVADNILVAVQA